MDQRNKPTVINLGRHLNRSTSISDLSRNNAINSFDDPLEPTEKELKNLYMISECDAELKNDFQWLINFNLKEVLGYIDDDYEENKIQKQEYCQIKENLHKYEYKIPLFEIVEQCLLEKDGVTIRDIYKWISTRFPCFKSKDFKWKNFVRKTLIKNPLFKSTKSKGGKNGLWYLYKNFPIETNHNYQKNDFSSTESNLVKPRKSRQSRIKKEVTPKIMTKHLEECDSFNDSSMSYRPEMDEFQTSTVQLYSSENWVDTTGFQAKDYFIEVMKQVPPEYFEIQTTLPQFLTKNDEPLQVENLFYENTASISLELL